MIDHQRSRLAAICAIVAFAISCRSPDVEPQYKVLCALVDGNGRALAGSESLPFHLRAYEPAGVTFAEPAADAHLVLEHAPYTVNAWLGSAAAVHGEGRPILALRIAVRGGDGVVPESAVEIRELPLRELALGQRLVARPTEPSAVGATPAEARCGVERLGG